LKQTMFIYLLLCPKLYYGWIVIYRKHRAFVRRRVFEVDEATSLIARPKKELVDMCRQARLKVSGTKAELVDRILAHEQEKVETESSSISLPGVKDEDLTQEKDKFSSPRRESELAEAAIDLLVTELVAIGAPEKIDPVILTTKTDALLAEGGAVFERVRKRRLAVSTDPVLRGTFALLQGFVAGHQRTRSRDAVRYMLRAATDSSQAIDKAFEDLRDAGKLDKPLQDYVSGLLRDKKLRNGPDALTDNPNEETDDLLSKVLLILSDRIQAELKVATQATDPDCFRTLARAMQIPDDRRQDYLKEKLSTSLDFALRFEKYVDDALAYVQEQEHNGVPVNIDTLFDSKPPSLTRAQCQAIREIQRLVVQIRSSMPL